MGLEEHSFALPQVPGAIFGRPPGSQPGLDRPDLPAGREMDPAPDGPASGRAGHRTARFPGRSSLCWTPFAIARKATFGVVSGSTGYAWIINPEGILLDHYETDFVGRSIFEVRKARNPKLSYQAIDDLTRGELLKKKEGTAQYISGWHRSRVTRTQKLIAYTPIPFYETPERTGRPQPLAGRGVLVRGPGGPDRRGFRIDRQSEYPAVPADRDLSVADHFRHRFVDLHLQSLVQLPWPSKWTARPRNSRNLRKN